METSENLAVLPIPDLIERFEKDIRFGCHSILTEISRSQAGKELERRSKEEVIPVLHSRWKELGESTLDGVEKRVHSGIATLMQLIEQN